MKRSKTFAREDEGQKPRGFALLLPILTNIPNGIMQCGRSLVVMPLLQRSLR